MINKVTTYAEALDAIEAIDKEICALLEIEKDYAGILLLMQKRLVYISEITRLKASIAMTESVQIRINQIFESANSVQEKVKNKRDRIKLRLDKNAQLEIKNKKLNYN